MLFYSVLVTPSFFFSVKTVKTEKELVVRSSSDSSSLSRSSGLKVNTNTYEKDGVDGYLSVPPIPPPRSSSTSRHDVVAANANGNGNGNGMMTHSGEGGSKIDIHVTVTVNPFSPGTLADLKKQRALSRASQSSYTLSPAASTYSLTTPEYDPRTHGRNPEFTASSVRVDTVSYRPPASPSLTPRKFCGDPAEVIGGVDAQSCCSMM